MELLLCGDVMTGRGIDQILPHPGDPELREAYARDARAYVELAEAANGPIPRPVDFAWPWGDMLPLLRDIRPDVCVLNLETSITRSTEFAPGKGIHYRMHPDNLPCLAAIEPDVCALANNHVLDFGRLGLLETLDVLGRAGLRPVGAGRDTEEARRPAIVPIRSGERAVVFAFGMPSSGIPSSWAAEDGPHDGPKAGPKAGPEGGAGIDLVPDLSEASSTEIVDRVRRLRRPGDVAVASIHWGANWGYRVDRHRVRFAHRLIDGGVDLVHGHSAHHPGPVEVYRDRLILYGCGDLINDYEGIAGREAYRPNLRLIYLASVEPGSGRLRRLRMVPMEVHRMRLQRAVNADAAWLRDTLDRVSRPFGARFDLDRDGMLTLGPDPDSSSASGGGQRRSPGP